MCFNISKIVKISMEKTFLLSSGFGNNGYGAQDAAKELIKLNIGLEPVDISNIRFKTKKTQVNI